jgi:hypothetical protein
MLPLSRFAWAACALLLLSVAGRSAGAATSCPDDQAKGPARSAVITLTAADLYDSDRSEMRTFVETGSLGEVEARLISSTPHGIVGSLAANPGISRLSPYFGEHLKGINVTVSLLHLRKSPTVRIRLRQVCAKRMVNTFLYY